VRGEIHALTSFTSGKLRFKEVDGTLDYGDKTPLTSF